MQEMRMNIMSARNLSDLRTRRQRLLDQPELLGRRPSPSPLRARQNRNRDLIRPFNLQVNEQISAPDEIPGMRPLSEGYLLKIDRDEQRAAARCLTSAESSQKHCELNKLAVFEGQFSKRRSL